jgi:AcrR family transcriptional regulator
MGTRDTILDAAADIMRTRGMANATTKQIAKAAGFSEATLYKHFRDKEEIFIDVLRERLPTFTPMVSALQGSAGRDGLRDALAEVGRRAIAFYYESFPIAASVFSEHGLLAHHRSVLASRGAGPHKAGETLAGYLRAEQKHGRIAPSARPDAVAAMLLGACLQYAFLGSFAGRPLDSAAAQSYVDEIVDTLMPALTPRTAR